MKKYVSSIADDLFINLLLTYFILLILEQIRPLTVTPYFKLHYLLLIVVILALLRVQKGESKRKKGTIYAIPLAVFVGISIKLNTQNIHWLGWVFALIGGILTYLLLQVKERKK